MISQMNAANSTFSERMSSCPIRALATETAGSSFWKLDGDWGLRENTVMAKLPADGTANLERTNSGYLGGGAPPPVPVSWHCHPSQLKELTRTPEVRVQCAYIYYNIYYSIPRVPRSGRMSAGQCYR